MPRTRTQLIEALFDIADSKNLTLTLERACFWTGSVVHKHEMTPEQIATAARELYEYYKPRTWTDHTLLTRITEEVVNSVIEVVE